MRILVVDDDPVFREELTDLLEEEGHQVSSAPSVQKGEEALEAEEFDVVLTDLKMPRKNGMELLRLIRTRWPRTLVVVVTGFASVETALEAMKLGAFDYVRKPFRLDQIRSTLALAAQEHEFAAPQGTTRDPAREARSLAREEDRHVLFVGDGTAVKAPRVESVAIESLEPADLVPMVAGFVSEHPSSAVVVASIDLWLRSHRLEEIVDVLDQVRQTVAGHGPLRVGFNPEAVGESAAAALGSSVAADATHATLEALANPIRRKVLLRLAEGPASFGEAMHASGIDDSPKFSFHLRKLSESGLVLHEEERYRLTARGQASVRLLAAAAFLPTADDLASQAFPRRGAPAPKPND